MAQRRRRRARCALLVACVCAASLVPRAHGLANIDVGFEQDGKTTYCQGVQDDQGPLVFEALDVSSSGKCPIDVTITASASTINEQTPLTVRWTAAVHQGTLATNLFPNAVDSATKKPQDVIASLLRACKAGTNCAVPESVVEPAVVLGDTSTDTGAFDSSGTKSLKSYQFQFATTGEEYVIVGKVVLPGDPKLNVSAQEFVAFQHIKVGVETMPVTPEAGTVRPGDASSVKDSDALLVKSTTAEPAAAQLTTQTPAAGGTTNGSGSGVNMQTISIVGVAGVVVVLLVVGYSVIVVKERRDMSIAQRQQLQLQQRSLSADYPHGGPGAATGPPSRRPSAQGHYNASISRRSRDSRRSSQKGHGRMSRASGPKISGAGPGGLGGPGGAVGGYGVMIGGRFTWRGLNRQTSQPRRSGAQYSIHNPRRSSAAVPTEMGMPPHYPRKDRPPPPPLPGELPPFWAQGAKPRASKDTGQAPMPRVISTSSTQSEDYSSSEDSAYSLGIMSGSGSYGHPAILGEARPVSYGDPTILGTGDREKRAFSLGRRSTVALLEASILSSEHSSLSSLGSLHDSSEKISPTPRRMTVEDSRVSRGSRNGSSVLGSYQSGASVLYRPSTNDTDPFAGSLHTAGGRSSVRRTTVGDGRASRSTRSGLSIPGSYQSRDGASVLYRPSANATDPFANSARGTAFFARDTSEYGKPFEARNSEADDWDCFSVEDVNHSL